MGECKRRPEKKINPRLFAEARMRGARVEEAMLRAGYSQTSAKRGWTQASKKCKEAYAIALNMTLAQLEETGGKLTPQQRRKVIIGKSLRNIAEGKDESVASMKLLGNDRELSMFQPESMTGLIVIDTRVKLPPFTAVPEIEAEIDFSPQPGHGPAPLRDSELLDRGAKAGGQG